MYRAAAQIFGLWTIVLIEAVAFAAVPGTVAWAITSGGGKAWLAPVCTFVTAVTALGARQLLDTRIYVGFWRNKIVELFVSDRESARAKALRWNDALKRLESLGPATLRGATELVVATLYIGSVSSTLAWLTLLAGLPYVLSGYWVTQKVTAIAARLNELALEEANLYARGDAVDAEDYYRKQYALAVAESDADAAGYFVGNSAIWVLRFASLYVLQQHGTSPAVLFAVLMYSQRLADGLDRLTIGMRNLAVVLTIIKV